MHPNCRNLGARSSGRWRIKAFRAVDTAPGAEYNSSGACIACIEFSVSSRAQQKGKCRGRSGNSGMKNFRTGVRGSPIAGGHLDVDGFAAFCHPFSWLVWARDQPNRGTAADARAGFSERHRQFDHTGNGRRSRAPLYSVGRKDPTLAPQAASAAGAESGFLINMF